MRHMPVRIHGYTATAIEFQMHADMYVGTYPKIAFSSIQNLNRHTQSRVVGMFKAHDALRSMRNVRALDSWETDNNRLFMVSLVESINSESGTLTSFAGFLPSSLSVCEARGTGSSEIASSLSPKCLPHVLRGFSTARMFPATEKRAPFGLVTIGPSSLAPLAISST